MRIGAERTACRFNDRRTLARLWEERRALAVLCFCVLVNGWQKQNLESRAKKCALKKVPHLKSSPYGRGEERGAELCKGLIEGRGED
jgi:hypothetical protein